MVQDFCSTPAKRFGVLVQLDAQSTVLLEFAVGSLGGSKKDKYIKISLHQPMNQPINSLINSQVAPMDSKAGWWPHTPYLSDDITDMGHILCGTIWYHQEKYKSDTLHTLANI